MENNLRRFRIVLTTGTRIVTEYVDVEDRRGALGAIQELLEKHELEGKLKRTPEVIEVNPANNRRLPQPTRNILPALKVRR